MSLSELILANRSYRSFDPSATLNREALKGWVDAARLSPSSRNLQPLKFRLVYEPSECNKVLPSIRWAGYLQGCEIPPAGHAPTAYIIICLDTSLTTNPVPFQRDVGICAQSILLAATEAGYGGCMIGSFSPDALKKDLELPPEIVPQLVLALGHPDETVTLTEVASDGDIKYYREKGIHYVPKRALEDILL